ncbi:response regulator transcription factor [Dysgonomonas sp. Marseille-P4677]|uniref:response regulator transcription factor n=1 Tax=Dysgonomonas sp. Marseille-P4677 TaxID=2364790 RepID=UPI0019125D87|nr:response regulator transcription factor [Dysgonomonas sp. Marseille-P4677]MBK5719292.1 response regulator transcription factor [Dysgonomonas sp. Marseille-P4677]
MKDVIIADKQDITRVGIQTLVEGIEKASSLIFSDTKIDLIKSLTSCPNAVVILDYTLSDFGSVDELLNIGYRFPESRWMLFSDELSYDFLRRLIISSEAYSVVLKSCELDEINMGLVHVFRGERFICARVTNQLLQVQKPVTDSLDHILTATEKEILKEMALGRTTKEIAAKRNLSFHTIITHRKNIFRKLEVNNVHEAIKYAMRAGLVDLAEYYI